MFGRPPEGAALPVTARAPAAPGREFDLAALIAIRPNLLAADRALLQLASEALRPRRGKDAPP